MAQSVRVKEMETYIKRLGEVLNVVYRRMTAVEARMKSLESDLAKLKADLEASRTVVESLAGQSVRKQEFDELVSSLASSLKELVPEPSGELATQQ